MRYPNAQNNPAGAIPVYLAAGAPSTVEPAVPFPATINAGATYDSGVIAAAGALNLVVCATLDQAGVIAVTRYADAAGNAPIDQATNQFAQPGAQSVVVNDGVPFLAYRVQITNNGAVPANLSNAVILAG